MMNLNKRYRRNIRHSLSFYISATLLTALGVLFLISMNSALNAIDTGFSEIMRTQNVEDAQFTTLKPIAENEIRELEKSFRVELEKIRYIDIKEEDYTVRVFAKTVKINTVAVLEGADIAANDEILLNWDFAVANGLEPGDSLSVGGKWYRISGIAVRPDYLYAQKNSTDFYVDDASFGQVTMSQNAFDKLENTQSYYTVIYREDNSVAFRKTLFENYYSINYLPAYANNRIAMAVDNGDQYGIILTILIPFMFGMISVIVTVVLGRKISREKKQIGTLVAPGYRKGELVRHYSIYALIPGIMGSLVGILFSILLIRPLVLLTATDFETVNYDIGIHFSAIVLSLLIPSAMYLFVTVISVLRLLRKNTILLLAGGTESSKKKSRFLVDRKISFRHKFRLRALLANKSRTFVVISGMLVGGFLCVFGYIMIDSCNFLIKTGLDAAGRYEYQYVLNTLETEAPTEGEPMLSAIFEAKETNDPITLSGLVENPKNLEMKTKSGAPVEYGNFYLSSSAEALFGAGSGDEFTFINMLTTEEYTVTIKDIIIDNTQSTLYTSSAEAARLLGLPDGSYNVILSDKELDIDPNIIAIERSKSEIKEQLDFGIRMMMKMIYILIVLGVVICIISVYLTVNMLVEENRHNISMLKVLGYRDKEINRLVLSVNHILVPISYVLCTIVSIAICGLMFKSFISEFNLYIEPVITFSSMLICLGILVASYYAALIMLKRKAYRIDMVESLKDNRE
jgi:putative ABC transport system permease protein